MESKNIGLLLVCHLAIDPHVNSGAELVSPSDRMFAKICCTPAVENNCLPHVY